MSNCVDIYTDTAIPLSHINHLRLFEEMDRVNSLEFSWEMPLEEHIIWWYLGRENVIIDDNLLVITWGKHRSSHTWRDLAQTAHTLAKYITVDGTVFCPVKMSDESDGHKKEYRYDIPLERLK